MDENDSIKGETTEKLYFSDLLNPDEFDFLSRVFGWYEKLCFDFEYRISKWSRDKLVEFLQSKKKYIYIAEREKGSSKYRFLADYGDPFSELTIQIWCCPTRRNEKTGARISQGFVYIDENLSGVQNRHVQFYDGYRRLHDQASSPSGFAPYISREAPMCLSGFPDNTNLRKAILKYVNSLAYDNKPLSSRDDIAIFFASWNDELKVYDDVVVSIGDTLAATDFSASTVGFNEIYPRLQRISFAPNFLDGRDVYIAFARFVYYLRVQLDDTERSLNESDIQFRMKKGFILPLHAIESMAYDGEVNDNESIIDLFYATYVQ